MDEPVDPQPTEQTDAEKAAAQKRFNMGCLAILVGIPLLMGVCTWLGEDDAPTRSGSGGGTVQTDDTLGEAACGHFRNVMGDIQRGVLNDSEIREKLREVYDTGDGADSRAVRAASEAMFAAATAGDTTALLEAAGEMDSACRAIGS